MALHRPSPILSLKSIITLSFTIFLHLTIFDSGALASPFLSIATSPVQLSKRYDDSKISPPGSQNGQDTSPYPDDKQIKADYISARAPTVFYSNIGAPDKAHEFAASIGGRLLSDAFPPGYIAYNGRGKKWYENFADRASGFLADKASGEVFFVGRWDLAVDNCRIWARVEYQSLLDNPDVTKITLVDYSNFDNKKDYPGLPNQKVKRGNRYCFDWDGDREDPLGQPSDPGLDIGYYPGNCGVHVVQYQKNEGKLNPGTTYRLDITLKDDQSETVGQVLFADAPSGQDVDVASALPSVFIATAQDVDDDPLKFRYGSQSWDSNSPQCSVGKYDSGSRNMDCGFSC